MTQNRNGASCRAPVLGLLLLASAALAQDADDAVPGDAEAYNAHCGVCHQEDGQGVPGAFPPLAGSQFLVENPELTIDIALFGLDKPVLIRDVFYAGSMPAVDFLSNEQIADIITYTLNAWGNEGGTVTAEDVAERRELGAPVAISGED